MSRNHLFLKIRLRNLDRKSENGEGSSSVTFESRYIDGVHLFLDMPDHFGSFNWSDPFHLQVVAQPETVMNVVDAFLLPTCGKF